MAKKIRYIPPTAEMFRPDVGASAGGTTTETDSITSAGAVPADAMTLKQVFNNGLGWVKAHPWQAAGTGVLGAVNLGGLFDNDQLLGQGIGTALGAAAPAIFTGITKIPLNIGTLGRVNLAMGGGALGALFDTLRAKQAEQESQRQMKYRSGG